MDFESSLIARVIENGELPEVLEARVTPAFFEDDSNAIAFSWIIDYYAQYGVPPTRKAFRSAFPTYVIADVNEPMAFLIDELRAQREYAILHDAAAQLGQALKSQDTKSARQYMLDAITSLDVETNTTHDIDITVNALQRYDLYESWRDMPGGLRGLPTGFSSLDTSLLGLQDSQLITILGLPKSGKSTLALLIAMAVQDYGAEGMLVGFEMSNLEQQCRYDAFRANVDWRKLMSGRLDPRESMALEKSLRAIENKAKLTMIADPSATSTISLLAAKVDQYKPDIVIVDGVYMMDAELPNVEPGSAAALTYITRSLKRLAQRVERPIVCTTQALFRRYNRASGLTMGSIGYTSSFAQDSDAIIGIEGVLDDKDKGKEAPDLRKVSIVAARNAVQTSVIVRWGWLTGEFEEIGSVDGETAGPGIDRVR